MQLSYVCMSFLLFLKVWGLFANFALNIWLTHGFFAQYSLKLSLPKLNIMWLSEFSFSFHIGRDAAALAEFWCWLEKEIENNVTLTEVDVADKLLEFRQKQDFFIETSFDTISGMFPCSCWQFCPTIYKLLHLRYILSGLFQVLVYPEVPGLIAMP